jgi:hypothetical protein
MLNNNAARLLLFLLLWPIFPTYAGESNEPALADIILTTSESHLLLFARVENGFTPEMIETVQNGIPVSFDFRVELDRVRSNWFDSNLVSRFITHTLLYDTLKQEYEVRSSENNNHTQRFKSLEKAILAMTELNGLKVVELDQLRPEAPYALGLKVKLAEKTLPLGMHSIIPFMSLWDFETPWRTIEFRY